MATDLFDQENLRMGDIVDAILAVDNPQDAIDFVGAYYVWQRKHDPTMETLSTMEMIRANIGWCFGEGMPLERRKMWNEVCGATHRLMPELTYSNPTPEEIFEAGRKWGERIRRGES